MLLNARYARIKFTEGGALVKPSPTISRLIIFLSTKSTADKNKASRETLPSIYFSPEKDLGGARATSNSTTRRPNGVDVPKFLFHSFALVPERKVFAHLWFSVAQFCFYY